MDKPSEREVVAEAIEGPIKRGKTLGQIADAAIFAINSFRSGEEFCHWILRDDRTTIDPHGSPGWWDANNPPVICPTCNTRVKVRNG